MPRFYFHLNNSTGWTKDHEGREFEGAAEALQSAYLEARALVAAEVLAGQAIKLASYILIVDREDNEIGRVSYEEAVEFE